MVARPTIPGIFVVVEQLHFETKLMGLSGAGQVNY